VASIYRDGHFRKGVPVLRPAGQITAVIGNQHRGDMKTTYRSLPNIDTIQANSRFRSL
jgi:hypothetical protein